MPIMNEMRLPNMNLLIVQYYSITNDMMSFCDSMLWIMYKIKPVTST